MPEGRLIKNRLKLQLKQIDYKECVKVGYMNNPLKDCQDQFSMLVEERRCQTIFNSQNQLYVCTKVQCCV